MSKLRRRRVLRARRRRRGELLFSRRTSSDAQSPEGKSRRRQGAQTLRRLSYEDVAAASRRADEFAVAAAEFYYDGNFGVIRFCEIDFGRCDLGCGRRHFGMELHFIYGSRSP